MFAILVVLAVYNNVRHRSAALPDHYASQRDAPFHLPFMSVGLRCIGTLPERVVVIAERPLQQVR